MRRKKTPPKPEDIIYKACLKIVKPKKETVEPHYQTLRDFKRAIDRDFNFNYFETDFNPFEG